MLFRQLFDSVSCTYTYLLAGEAGGEALLIDPVIDKVDVYLQLLDELDLRLVKAVDTHVHADHVTGLGVLRDRTGCITVMGKISQVNLVSMRVDEGDTIEIDGVRLDVLYTPGHTDDSYSFVMPDRVFTGDTLLIRGSGRTDFQNGDPLAAYDSLFNKLLQLPDDTRVYPGHDYNGFTVSTIAEERAHNPRLQVDSAEAYAEIMNGLDLADPKLMDVAVPANLAIGLSLDEARLRDATLDAVEAVAAFPNSDWLVVDLRETGERQRDGVIPDSVHVPYPSLEKTLGKGELLASLAEQSGKRLVLFCAYGERSALGLRHAWQAGFKDAVHIGGGMDAWRKAGGETRAT
ncbi:MAG: MBL fold metallo-hydrolase [Gammaproteobacteria bacterium]|jgi:glyoxylase-like metal-dependent hydrolase (beta-lactamase superfamily II)|nr:MBL fold metallo-hydrolase [Gammaproteobacteria bacterium]